MNAFTAVEGKQIKERESSPIAGLRGVFQRSEVITMDASKQALQQNIEAYGRLLPSLLREHRGDYILIADAEPVTTRGTREQALEEGYRRFGFHPFFVQKIEPLEEEQADKNGNPAPAP